MLWMKFTEWYWMNEWSRFESHNSKCHVIWINCMVNKPCWRRHKLALSWKESLLSCIGTATIGFCVSASDVLISHDKTSVGFRCAGDEEWKSLYFVSILFNFFRKKKVYLNTKNDMEPLFYTYKSTHTGCSTRENNTYRSKLLSPTEESVFRRY